MTESYYDRDVHSKSKRELRSIEFNAVVARFLVHMGWTGSEIAERVCEELYFHHSGRLFDLEKRLIDLDTTEIEDDFPDDARRAMNAYKKRAEGGATYRLDARCIRRVMWVYLAIVVYCGRHNIDLNDFGLG